MSRPPRDSTFRFGTATLDWARKRHATLDEWPARRADPHRVRAALLTQSLRSAFERIRGRP